MTSMLSREALFLLNNLLFMGILVVCFWGVIFPLISELFTGQKVTVGPPFYERATGPLFAGLLLLMGIAPLSAWRHSTAKTLGRAIWKPFLASLVVLVIADHCWACASSAALLGFWLCAFVASVTLYEFWRGALARHRSRRREPARWRLWRLAGRNRRRYGGYIIHLGVVLMAIGHHRHRDVPDRDPGHDPAGRVSSRWAITPSRYDSLADFDYTGWAQRGPRRGERVQRWQATSASCTHAAIIITNPSSR